MKRLAQYESTLSLLVIFVAMVISYGLFIPRLGFYWDDWFFTWLGHSEGSNAVYEILAQHREGTGLQFAGTYTVLGNHVLLYHAWMFVLRLVGGIFFWMGVRRLWRNQPIAITIMTLLLCSIRATGSRGTRWPSKIIWQRRRWPQFPSPP